MEALLSVVVMPLVQSFVRCVVFGFLKVLLQFLFGFPTAAGKIAQVPR